MSNFIIGVIIGIIIGVVFGFILTTVLTISKISFYEDTIRKLRREAIRFNERDDV